jgi:hypothetical protein
LWNLGPFVLQSHGWYLIDGACSLEYSCAITAVRGDSNTFITRMDECLWAQTRANTALGVRASVARGCLCVSGTSQLVNPKRPKVKPGESLWEPIL